MLKLTLAYDGRGFKGWQKGNGRTVQGVLEAALLAALGRASEGAVRPGSVTPEDLYLIGAGRTDAGVHAAGQVASVRVPGAVRPDGLLEAVNREVPEDLAVLACVEADDRFHAQYRALGKTYRYRIVDGPAGDPFLAPYAWRIPERLDVSAMAAAAGSLRGRHDFTSLTADKSKKDHTRTITDLRVERHGIVVDIVVEGDGFLWNQVRIMAALLLQAGQGTLAPADLTRLLDARDRSLAPPPAPAKGLCLVAVAYAEGLNVDPKTTIL